jgi:hypothetical protein
VTLTRAKELLLKAREYIYGCSRSSDEVCTCAECNEATALLDSIDTEIDSSEES